MEHILSLSYGKDSLACLGAIEKLGWPLDRIVHAEVWATDTIPADLPPMVEFKAKADRTIKERWGIEVEHICVEKKTARNGLTKKIFTNPLRRKRCKNVCQTRIGLGVVVQKFTGFHVEKERGATN